jgi:hypothetical protein
MTRLAYMTRKEDEVKLRKLSVSLPPSSHYGCQSTRRIASKTYQDTALHFLFNSVTATAAHFIRSKRGE